jgi:hypothetical protein
LTVLDRIHDLPRAHPQISLGDLGLTAHRTNVAPVATACHIVADVFAALDLLPDDDIPVPDGWSAAELRAFYAAWRSELAGLARTADSPLMGLPMAC